MYIIAQNSENANNNIDICGVLCYNRSIFLKRRIYVPNYVVLQVVLKEKLIGTGSGNLSELEKVINAQAAKGYRLHTITTSSSGSKGFLGGDRIQATMVFESLNRA